MVSAPPSELSAPLPIPHFHPVSPHPPNTPPYSHHAVQARDGFGNLCAADPAEGEEGLVFTAHISGSVPSSEEFEEEFKKYKAKVFTTPIGGGHFELCWSVDLPGEYSLQARASSLLPPPPRGHLFTHPSFAEFVCAYLIPNRSSS